MLRSQGIPARMVVGYKCDEYNPLGNFFQVRQLHAHTWVEAYPRTRTTLRRPGRPPVAQRRLAPARPDARQRRRPRRGRDRARAGGPRARLVRLDLEQLRHGDGPLAAAPGDLPAASSAGARTPGAAWPIPSGGGRSGRRPFGRSIRATGTSASGSVGAADWWRWPSPWCSFSCFARRDPCSAPSGGGCGRTTTAGAAADRVEARILPAAPRPSGPSRPAPPDRPNPARIRPTRRACSWPSGSATRVSPRCPARSPTRSTRSASAGCPWTTHATRR